MKSPIITADDVAVGARVEAGQTTPSGLLARIRDGLAALGRAHAQWALRAELAALDDHVLKDIGIAHDELPRVRARDDFTPRAWRV